MAAEGQSEDLVQSTIEIIDTAHSYRHELSGLLDNLTALEDQVLSAMFAFVIYSDFLLFPFITPKTIPKLFKTNVSMFGGQVSCMLLLTLFFSVSGTTKYSYRI